MKMRKTHRIWYLQADN